MDDAACIHDDDEDGDDDDNNDGDDLIMIAKFTVNAVAARVTGTTRFSSPDLTSMIDNQRWIGEQQYCHTTQE